MAAERTRYLHFRGSSTVTPLIQAASPLYCREHPGEALVLTGGGTDRGYKAVLEGTSDVGMVSSEMSEQIARLAKRQGVALSTSPIGYDALVAFVHPQNPVTSLSQEVLRDVFTGRVRNWMDLGGPDAPIAVLSPSSSQGTFEAWRRLVIGERAVIRPDAQIVDGRELVRRIAADPLAIGYGTTLLMGPGTRALEVGGVAATFDTLASGAYPVRRQLLLVAAAEPEPRVQAFLAWFKDPAKGGQVIRQFDVVPAE